MPSIATTIAADRVVELQSTTAAGALEELVAAICKSAEIAPEVREREPQLMKAIREREELSSTAIDGGLALPHARLPGLKAFVIALGRARAGIDFGAQDGRKVHIFLMLAGPDGTERQPDYLKLLRSATQFLRNEKQRLLDLDDVTMAYALCQEHRAAERAERTARPAPPASSPTGPVRAPLGGSVGGAVANARLVARACAPLRGRIAVVGLLTAIHAMLEGAVLACLIPTFELITGEQARAGSASSTLRARFEALGLDYTFGALFSLVVALTVAYTIVRIVAEAGGATAIVVCTTRTRRLLFGKLMRMSWPFYQGERVGHMIRSVDGEVARAGLALRNAMISFNLILTIACYVAVAAWLSPLVAFTALGLVAASTLLLLPVFAATRRGGAEVVRRGRAITHRETELLGGYRVVKASGVEDAVVEQVGGMVRELERVERRQAWLRAIAASVMEPLVVLFVIGYVFFMTVTWQVRLAEATVVGLLVLRICQRFGTIQRCLAFVADQAPSVEHVVGFERELDAAQEATTGAPVGRWERIALEGVSLRFDDQRAALAGVDLAIERGAFVGIVGESGAGKSSLVDLLLALHRPTEGRVAVDDRPLGALDLLAWRRRIGYVAQETALFDATVADNIALFRDDTDRAAIERAARLANAHGFIEALPQGYDTPLGDRGLHLSGGERQRIALARALVVRPDLLVLDEATSALDAAAEAALLEAIEQLRGETTIVSVSHRLSTVMGADRVVVLESGRVVESGRPDELRRGGGAFGRLYQLQATGGSDTWRRED